MSGRPWPNSCFPQDPCGQGGVGVFDVTPDRVATWTGPDGTVYWSGPINDRQVA